MRESPRASPPILRHGDREVTMFHHVQLSVSDFKRSLQFWRDALEPLGVTHVDMPCTAERVWRAIQDAHDTSR